MRVREPDYYGAFRCLAGACPHTCCEKWEVVIDEETARLYGTVPGPLGEKLRAAMAVDEDGDVCFPLSGCSNACTFHARLTENLTALLAGKNLALTRKMGHMARRTTRDKLLSYLSAAALAAGTPEFDIPLDRQQLADFLAVDRSAMSAALGKLRDEGVLTFRKNHFHLLRPEELTD